MTKQELLIEMEQVALGLKYELKGLKEQAESVNRKIGDLSNEAERLAKLIRDFGGEA